MSFTLYTRTGREKYGSLLTFDKKKIVMEGKGRLWIIFNSLKHATGPKIS